MNTLTDNDDYNSGAPEETTPGTALSPQQAHPPHLDRLTEWVPTETLVLDPESARNHDAAIPHLVESIKEFGLTVPVIVTRSLRVIAGNARVKAARLLGLPQVLIRWFEGTDLQATKYALADNRVRDYSTWNEEVQAKLLERLKAEDNFTGTGFSQADFDALMAKLKAETKTLGDDDGPGDPPACAVTLPGDLWVLGDHRLLCGDSTKPEDVALVLEGAKATLLATDPPYAVNYDGTNRPGRDGGKGGKDWSALLNERSIADYEGFMDLVFAATVPHLALQAQLYVWHAHTQQPGIAAAFRRRNLLLHQFVVWVKPSPAFGRSYFHWKHEVCAFGWVKGQMPKLGAGQYSTVWDFDWEGKSRVTGNQHPTQKPTALFELPMKLHTQPGDVVLEPFSGSGSQIIAAEKLGRRCRAIEIQPVFVDIAIQRWERLTKQQAVLSSSGRTFGEMSEERRAA